MKDFCCSACVCFFSCSLSFAVDTWWWLVKSSIKYYLPGIMGIYQNYFRYAFLSKYFSSQIFFFCCSVLLFQHWVLGCCWFAVVCWDFFVLVCFLVDWGFVCVFLFVWGVFIWFFFLIFLCIPFFFFICYCMVDVAFGLFCLCVHYKFLINKSCRAVNQNKYLGSGFLFERGL